MNITERYDIQDILKEIEAVLQIDGKDYGEQNVDNIISTVVKRIAIQYGLDVSKNKITDDIHFVGDTRTSAVLFIDNCTMLHAKLSGYCQVLRHTSVKNKFVRCDISPRNINYVGATPEGFRDFLICAKVDETIPRIDTVLEYIKSKFCTIQMCLEKRILLIMIVARYLGINEFVSCCAEIMYLGGQI